MRRSSLLGVLSTVLFVGCGGELAASAGPDCLWLGDFEAGEHWEASTECAREARIPPGGSTTLTGWLPSTLRLPKKFLYFDVLLRKSTNGSRGNGETTAKWLSPYTNSASELRAFELRESGALYLQGWTEILQTDVGIPGVTLRLSSPVGDSVPFVVRVERIRAVMVEPKEVQAVSRQLNVPVRGTMLTAMPVRGDAVQ